MFPPSIFEDRCVDFRRSMHRPSKIDVTMCRPSKINVSTFGDRSVDLRRSTCRRVDLRRSVIDVSTFEDRCSMCRPSNIDSRCEIRLLYLLKTLIAVCELRRWFALQCCHYYSRTSDTARVVALTRTRIRAHYYYYYYYYYFYFIISKTRRAFAVQ